METPEINQFTEHPMTIQAIPIDHITSDTVVAARDTGCLLLEAPEDETSPDARFPTVGKLHSAEDLTCEALERLVWPDGPAAVAPPVPRVGMGERLNKLRAGVMGANDGIVSTAGMIVGVAGAAAGSATILAAGVAATVAGALSMAVGEYLSVSSQRDSLVAHSAHELTTEQQGLANPWHAARASMISFVIGALVPLAALVSAPEASAVPITFSAVMVALAVTGAVAAHLGGAPKSRAALRTVLGGVAAMTATWAIGWLVGMQL